MQNLPTAPPTDRVIARLAARQHGLVTTRHLLDSGFVRNAIARRVAAGRLHRKYRGVYAVGQPKLSREGEFLAAVFACGDGALLGHFALAELRALSRYRASLVDVVVPSKRLAPPGIRVHEARRLDPRDVTTYRGIPCTSIARLFVDLADFQTPHELANVIHEAAYRGWFSAQATRDAMRRANGRHNLAVLDEALALNAAGSAGLKSRNEATFLRLLRAHRLPAPLVNVHLHGHEVDFHWPDLRLVVEMDGPGHARSRTKREDEAKERALEAAGYKILRFTDEDLTTRQEAVIASIATGG
jgi:very-short-patch-repair endonuclease